MSVVIPARNEEKNLPHVLSRLPHWVHEVVLVDGMSVDATCSVALQYLPSIRVVSQTGRGKGNALREGFRECTGDIIVALDADGSMDPGEMARLVAPLEDGFDCVKGSRSMPGGGSTDLTVVRRLGNLALCSLTNVLHGSRYSDLCYGYFAIRSENLATLDLRSDGFEIEAEISIRVQRAGLRVLEVPSHESPRIHGASNLNAVRDGFRVLWTIIKERFSGDLRANRRIEDEVVGELSPGVHSSQGIGSGSGGLGSVARLGVVGWHGESNADDTEADGRPLQR